ncbi:MAG TPA: beta-galactosidase [Candidatus Hydrogenedentes bacterium]|nr:beta-galactosidase [Candidatus Hydrogenedentota bacterium]HPC18282.1 beta-galactosidase [Candidatus Hydrogenedentota bacterium]HRT22002.1 beta-galactosidase [Candidatus Hydrogenedentota bacterium]HRT66697.1 beta-galactosidase [Candidatus Hydrogenedentota bacterium]
MIRAIGFISAAALAAAAFGDGLEGLSWRATPSGAEENGLRVLSGADGATTWTKQDGAPCIANQPGSTPPSVYLYFDIDDSRAEGAEGPVYLVIEYFDHAPGGIIQAEYDSATGEAHSARYLHNEDQWGGLCGGRKTWEKAVFLLASPRFRNGENLGADFRISGAPLFVRSMYLTRRRPDFADHLDTLDLARVKRLVEIGDGGEFIVGGFDPARKQDVSHMVRALRGAAPALKSLGVTSHEGYVRWNLCEPEEGRYDWSVYDAFVEVYKQSGLKWVPFLIVGSAYSLPDWYYKKPGSQGFVCLEHGETCDVESLWNPVLRGHVARFIQAFCEHYRDTGVIESILLGVTGNYGEAIYVATGNDWTADIHGPYHTHSGYWAGDPYAVKDFQQWLTKHYADIAALNKAWNAQIADFAAVRPFLRKDAPNDRAWLDFCQWYIGAMTDWSRFWMQETRKHFPKGGIYLCTGGHAPPEHGADFGDQCKAAAEIGGGVRITNEGSDYRANFSLTRWVASAGRQYGAYYSFEPAGEVNAQGVIARIYGATTSGALGLHYYYPNLFGSDAARENFVRWGRFFKQRDPNIEVAVYYPETFIRLNGNEFLGKVQPLRDCFDFDFMSDGQILDGGLKSIRALVLVNGNVSEAAVWATVAEWVKNGGLLLYPSGMGRLRTVEGDDQFHEALFGSQAEPGKGRVVVFDGKGTQAGYRAAVSGALVRARELGAATRAVIAADGREDQVYAALCGRDEVLWLNYTPHKVKKGNKVLPPYSIVSQHVRAIAAGRHDGW